MQDNADKGTLRVLQPIVARKGESLLSSMDEAIKKASICARLAGSDTIHLTAIIDEPIEEIEVEFSLDEGVDEER